MGAGIAKEKEKGGGKRDNGKGAVTPWQEYAVFSSEFQRYGG
jgi:hypothetical protein